MKYRLNIPDMISKEDAYLSWCLSGLSEIDEKWHNRDYMFKDIPKSWIGEIKESEFDKYMDSDYRQEEYPDDSFFKRYDMKHCWNASQENRDLLYKGLIQHVANISNNWTDGQLNLVKAELNKIKEQLNS